MTPENQVATTTVTTILVKETEGANVTTTMATRGASSPSSMWKRSSPRSSTESSVRPPLHLSSTSRPAAIRIEMVEPVGPSAYSLSLQAQRSPLEQWKLLKNKLIRKKSSDEDPVPDPAERFRQTVRAAAQEEGIICRTTELKRLLQKGERNASDHQTPSSSSCNRNEAHSPSFEVTEVTNPSSPSSIRKDHSSESSRKSSFKSLSPSCSSPSAPNHEANQTTVKWDEVSRPDLTGNKEPLINHTFFTQTNTLDASALGDAIESFLKGLSGPSSSPSPVRAPEKRVSFRWMDVERITGHHYQNHHLFLTIQVIVKMW